MTRHVSIAEDRCRCQYTPALPAVLMEHTIMLCRCNITCVRQNTSCMTVSFLRLYIIIMHCKKLSHSNNLLILEFTIAAWHCRATKHDTWKWMDFRKRMSEWDELACCEDTALVTFWSREQGKGVWFLNLFLYGLGFLCLPGRKMVVVWVMD